jgi:hypothetical protein
METEELKAEPPAAPVGTEVDGAYWRSVFITLSEILPPGLVVDFARTIPFELASRRYAGADLLEHVVLRDGKVPEAWDFSATLDLERFLARNGYTDATGFQEKVLNRNNKSTWIPGRMIIGMMFRLLWGIHAVKDARSVVFRLITLISKAMFPNQRFDLIHRENQGDWVRAVLLIATDKTFQTAHPANIDFAMIPQMQKAPMALGLPQFEEVRVLADCRSPEEILWGPGAAAAKDMGFNDFLAVAGCKGREDVPERTVRVAAQDVYCPVRKRMVIHAGCAYSAPVYLLEFKYRRVAWQEPMKKLTAVVDDVESESRLSDQRVAERFADLIRKYRQPQVLRYDHGERRVMHGKVEIASGYMAVTLRIVMTMLGEQREMEIRVKNVRKHSLYQGYKLINHNEINKRLRERLRRTFPVLELELKRGKLLIRRHGAVKMVMGESEE